MGRKRHGENDTGAVEGAGLISELLSCHAFLSKCLSKRRAREGVRRKFRVPRVVGEAGLHCRVACVRLPEPRPANHEQIHVCWGIREVPTAHLHGKHQHHQRTPKPHAGMGRGAACALTVTAATGLRTSPPRRQPVGIGATYQMGDC